MAEVRKLKGWREEGIDTSELERLLFTDIDSYNALKIKMLTERLERPSGNVPSGNDRIKDIDRMVPSSVPSSEGDEKDVITNSFTEAQKTPVNPPLNGKEAMESSFEGKKEMERTLRIGRFKVDRRKGRIALFSIITVLILIALSGAGSYILFLRPSEEPSELSALFTISDLHPVSGSLVNLSSSDGESIVHSWNIVPEDYEIFNGALSDYNISIYFTRSGSYRISHTVSRVGDTKESIRDLVVTPRTIRVDRESLNDRAEYSIFGNVEIDNVDTLFDFPDASDFRKMSLEFYSTEGTNSVSELGPDDTGFKDGYGKTYSTILRTIGHDLTIEGSITDSKGDIIPFDGSIETEERNHIDLFNRKMARMDVSTRTMIDIQVLSGKTEHVDILERTSMFPDLSTDYRDLRLEDIASDRYIEEDGFGTVLWGTSMLDWKVERVEVYEGAPCLNVSLWMEPGTLSSNDLDEFSLNLLLADSLPVAMRSIVHMRTVPDVPNPYTLDMAQGMVGFRKGLDPIIYGTIDSYHENTTNIFSIYSDLIPEYNEKWTYSPKQGTKKSSIPSDFDAEDAIAKFSGKPAFKNFVQGLSDPFCLYCNFSSQEGRGEMWKFSISDRSNPWGWNESVLRDSTVTSGFKTRIDPVGIGKDRIGGVLTFSGAETALKRLMVSIDQSYGKALYGMVPGDESELDMDRHSIMLIAEHRYPSIGLLNQGSFERIEYGMVIGSSDKEYEACIDMHSGQLLYLYSRAKV